MLDKFRKTLASFISPTKNSMSLPNQFLKYGNKRMDYDGTQVVMRDEDLYTGYGYAAIKLRANKVAHLAMENIRTEAENEDAVHPYLELIYNSKLFSEFQFWRDISTFLDLEGVYYLMAIRNSSPDRMGNVQEFKLLNPYNIRRVLDADQLEVVGYVETRKGLVREIPKEMIIPMRELNPFSEDKPFSMADAASESQFTIKTAGDYTRHTLKNNINTPGILTTDVILPEEDFLQFTQRVKNNTKGEPLFGNGAGAITFESMNIDLSKSALKDVNEMNRQALFSIAGVSKTSMGIEESGTTRDTSRVQKEINIEDHILPRIQLIVDALNLDYVNSYGQTNSVFIVVDNPMATDHEADLSETEVKKSQYDLYIGMINRGYEPELAAQFIKGEIDLDQLGEPTNEQFVDPNVQAKLMADTQVEEDEADNAFENSGMLKQQEGALKNAIVNVEEQLVVAAMSKVTKNRFENESEIVTKEEKSKAINELILVLTAFYGVTFNFKGQDVMRDRKGTFALPGTFKVDTQSKDYIRSLARKVSESHVDTVLDDILVTARQAALEGLSVPQIQSAIREKYSDTIVQTRAKAIARTETNRAFTRAQFEADRQFINQNNLQGRVFKQWRTRSDNPCPFCQALEAEGPKPFFEDFRGLGDIVEADGKTLNVNFESLEAGNAHVNCILPDSVVLAPETKNMLTTHYSGDVIKFTTINGRSLTVTPNHIMLTARGWVAAKNLLKTDSVISYSGWDKITMGNVDPANNNSPSTIEEIFASLFKNSHVSRSRVPITTKDLKGDGLFSHSEVDIISTNGLLGDKANAKISKFLTNHSLQSADVGATVPFIEKGNLSSMLIALGLASNGSMSSDRLTALLSGTDLTTEELASFLDTSSYNARIQQSSSNDTPRNTKLLSELLLRLPSLVTSDHISNIETLSYSGHVFDVTTMSSLYMVNGVITSNCSCDYELIIESEQDSLNRLQQQYQEMDKRTRQAKEMLEVINKERAKLKEDSKDIELIENILND